MKRKNSIILLIFIGITALCSKKVFTPKRNEKVLKNITPEKTPRMRTKKRAAHPIIVSKTELACFFAEADALFCDNSEQYSKVTYYSLCIIQQRLKHDQNKRTKLEQEKCSSYPLMQELAALFKRNDNLVCHPREIGDPPAPNRRK